MESITLHSWNWPATRWSAIQKELTLKLALVHVTTRIVLRKKNL